MCSESPNLCACLWPGSPVKGLWCSCSRRGAVIRADLSTIRVNQYKLRLCPRRRWRLAEVCWFLSSSCAKVSWTWWERPRECPGTEWRELHWEGQLSGRFVPRDHFHLSAYSLRRRRKNSHQWRLESRRESNISRNWAVCAHISKAIQVRPTFICFS